MRDLPSTDLGSNYANVWIGDVSLHFSYRTLIGYRTPASGRVRERERLGGRPRAST